MSYAFISYSRSDADYVNKLADKLRAEGFDFWLDQRSIDSGEEWFDAIEDALLGCGAFVLVMSPAARESQWVRKEIHIALDEGKRLFPLLLEGRRFGITADVNYADVSDGSLPDADFFNDLAKVIPRGQSSSAPPVVTPQTVSQEMKPSGAPLPYVPGKPLDVELRLAGLEQSIVERLTVLADSPPVRSSQNFAGNRFCAFGKVYVHSDGKNLVASIRISSLSENLIDLPDWKLIKTTSDMAFVSYFSSTSLGMLRGSICRRVWKPSEFKNGFGLIASEIIEASAKMSTELEDITIECVGL